jgi:energy-coupling factor transport system permease protein
MCFNHPIWLFTVFLVMLAIVAYVGILRHLRFIAVPMLIVALAPVITWPFFIEAEPPTIRFGPLVCSEAAILYALAMSFRWSAALLGGLVFISTIRPEELHDALTLMGLPQKIVFILAFAFRSVPTFVNSALGIIEAQESRGVDLKSGSLLNRIRSHLSVAIPLFMHAMRQTNMLAVALASRAYPSDERRTIYRLYKMKVLDYAALTIMLFVDVLAIYIRALGYGEVLGDRL